MTTMESLIGLVNRIQRVCTVLRDHGADGAKASFSSVRLPIPFVNRIQRYPSSPAKTATVFFLVSLGLQESETTVRKMSRRFKPIVSLPVPRGFKLRCVGSGMGMRISQPYCLQSMWSIILPVNWIKAFWISMVSHGAHAIGLRERRWIACESIAM
ncbi:Dynamin-related protein 1E [Nymphaea thermarum]|nr:Dynamin-related protein 1E [Nymphaea thermarum]